MSLLAPFTGRPATAADLSSIVRDFDTPLGQYLGAKLDQGYWNSLYGQFIEQTSLPPLATRELGVAPELGVEFRETQRRVQGLPEQFESASEGVQAELDARGIDYLTEDEWRESPFFREDMPFEPFMTADRARVKADVHDSNAFRDWLIEQRENGVFGAVAGFGATLAGGAPDPVNWVGLGLATRAVVAARASAGGARSIGVAAGAGALEAGVLTAATLPLLDSSLRFWGDDLTWAEAVLDIALGATTGGIFGGAAGALAGRSSSPARSSDAVDFSDVTEQPDLTGVRPVQAAEEAFEPTIRPQELDEALEDLSLAVGQTAQHQPVSFPPRPSQRPLDNMPAGRRVLDARDPITSAQAFIDEVTANPRRNDLHFIVGRVSTAGAERIRVGAGFEVEGFEVGITASDLRHILARHGPQSNAVRRGGEVAITAEDFARLGDYVEQAHFVGPGRDKLGNDAIEFRTQIGPNQEVGTITFVRRGRRALAALSMVKRPLGGGPPPKPLARPGRDGGGPAAPSAVPSREGQPASIRPKRPVGIAATANVAPQGRELKPAFREDPPIGAGAEADAKVLDQVQKPEKPAQAGEEDVDVAMYQDLERQGLVSESEAKDFKAAADEEARMEKIEEAYRQAASCVLRVA